MITYLKFQSTLPVRGATTALAAHMGITRISIHAPREGSDSETSRIAFMQSIFQSTLPVRGATQQAAGKGQRNGISIHAPREGSDCKPAQNKRRNFSRMPCFTEKNEKRGQKACIGWKTKAKKAAKGKKTRCEGYEKSMTACGPHFAFIPSKAPRRRSRAVRRHVQFGCGSGRPGYKTAGCLPVCR